MTFYFDLDGTVADLYAVEGWLPMLRSFDPSPYRNAKPMLNMSNFARLLHKAQRLGCRVGVVSWLSKDSTAEYDEAVTLAKLEWLAEHLPSVTFDEIKIVEYGTPKSDVVDDLLNGILFDDESNNRKGWQGLEAFEPNDILKILRELI